MTANVEIAQLKHPFSGIWGFASAFVMLEGENRQRIAHANLMQDRTVKHIVVEIPENLSVEDTAACANGLAHFVDKLNEREWRETGFS